MKLPVIACMCMVVGLCIFCTGCDNATKWQGPVLLLQGDSGTMTKKQALSFLLLTHITDTIDGYWIVGSWGDDDTIGKYFRMNERGDVLALVRVIDAKDSVETYVVVRLDASGRLKRYMRIPYNDLWCEKVGVTNFSRIGKYYLVSTCGHGSGFSSEHRYIFDDVDTGGGSCPIFFGNYYYFCTGDPRYAQMTDADMEIHGDSIVLLYTVQRGNKEKEEIEWQVERKARVAYVRVNGRWTTGDSSLLEGMDME